MVGRVNSLEQYASRLHAPFKKVLETYKKNPRSTLWAINLQKIESTVCTTTPRWEAHLVYTRLAKTEKQKQWQRQFHGVCRRVASEVRANFNEWKEWCRSVAHFKECAGLQPPKSKLKKKGH